MTDICYSEDVRSRRSQCADVQVATPPPPAVPPASLFRQQHQLTAATGSQGVKFPPTAPNQPPPPSQLALHFPAGRQPRQLPAGPSRPAQGRQSSVLNNMKLSISCVNLGSFNLMNSSKTCQAYNWKNGILYSFLGANNVALVANVLLA